MGGYALTSPFSTAGRRGWRPGTQSGNRAELFQRVKHLGRPDVAQALVMSKAAGARQARTACQCLVEDGGPLAQGTSARRIGRSKDCDRGNVERRGQVRRTRIV